MSRKLLNWFRCSNPSSGPKSQILPRAKLARFLGRALLATAEPWAVFLNLFCSSSPSSGRYRARYTCALSGSGPRARAWAAGAAGPRCSFCGLAIARALVFFARVVFVASLFLGLLQRFSWPRRGFPLPAIKKARQPFVIITLDPLSEHFRGRNVLGFARRRTSKLAGRCS